MTTNTSVDALICELELLQLEAARIHNAKSRIVEQIQQARMRERLLNNIACTTTASISHHTSVIEVDRDFQIGQRVIITNAAMINNQRPGATVTRLTATRVYLRTDAGKNTWRLRKHLDMFPTYQ